MKLPNLKCPSCGQKLEMDISDSSTHCDNCGYDFIVGQQITPLGLSISSIKAAKERTETIYKKQKEEKEKIEEERIAAQKREDKITLITSIAILIVLSASMISLSFYMDKKESQEITTTIPTTTSYQETTLEETTLEETTKEIESSTTTTTALTTTEEPTVEAETTTNFIETVTTTSAPEQKPVSQSYILNTSTMKFHYPSCKYVNKIKDEHIQSYYGSRDELISNNYSPCGHCHP